MLLFSPHHKFATSSSRHASLRSVKALFLTSRLCISYQQRCANAAAGVLPLVLGSSAVRHAQARCQHICAASSQPEQPQVQVAVLQDPSNVGNPACYMVGVSPDGGIPALNQVERLILDLRAQAPQQDIVLLLDPTAATAAVNNDASFAEQAAAAGVKWPGDLSSGELQTYLRMLKTAHLVQLEMQLPVDGNVRSQLAAGPPSEPSTVSSSSSSKSGSSSLSSLLASGLGFARRTANAAVSAVEAAAAAAAAADAAESEEAEQSGVDLVPDLPDLSLRMRRREWDPEQAVLSWHAAVLFCAMIKQLQDQGYEVEVRDDDEFSPDMPKHIQEAILEAAFEEARQHDTFRSFEIIKLLLTQAADSLQQKEPAIGEEEMQHWIALLMAAEDPKVVVIELETLLEEQITEHAALQEAGQEPPVVLLPTAFDVAQRLDAKYANGEGIDGDSGSGDDDSDSDGEEEGNTEEGEQIEGEEEGKGPGSSSSSSTEARLDAQAGAGYVVKGLPAEPKDVIRIGSGSSKTDDAAPSSSSEGSAAAGDAARGSSSSLDASDAVINARSNRQLVDAMMRLERSWNQAKEASTGSSSSSSSKGGSSKQGGKSVPELLPRPIRPPQPRGDAADSSSSSSAAGSSTGSVSSGSTSSSRSSSSGRSRSSPGSTEQSEQGAAVAGSGSSTAGSRIRRINRQAGPPAVASAAAGIEDPSAAAGTSSSSSSIGASAAADAAAAAADGAATVAGTDAAAAVGDSSNSSQSAGRSDTMSSSTAGDKQQQGRASEELPGRSAAQEQHQQQQQQGSAARSAGTPDNTGNSEPLRDQGAGSAAAEADAQSTILGSEPQRLQQCEEVPLLRRDDDAQLQRLVDERAAAVARSAAAAGNSGSRAAVAAAAAVGDAAGDGGAAIEVDAAAFAQHIRDSFSQFEDYLASTGVELSREARIEAFTEIYEDDFDSDDQLDELADAAERAAGGPWEHAQSWFQPEWWHAVIAGILNQDSASSSSSSSGEAAAVPADPDGKASKGQQQGSKGSQGLESLAARSNSSRSSGSNDGSSNGWDHIRSNFGQDGVDRLRDLLRGDSLLMTGVDINEMTILIAALNNLNHGERLSTAELRMVTRLLKEAEPDAESNSSSGGAADASAKSEKARKRQRGGTSSRRSSSLTRPPGFNVSAKDMPYNQDTRAIRLPKPYGRKRREQVQLFLKQLRQQQQQRKLVRQQRATQLQLWRLQQELLQGQQQQQQQQTGADGQQQQQQQHVLSQPLAASSSSSSAGNNAAGSSRRSRFAEAFKGFTAAWRQSMKDQAAAEQQQQQRQLDELQAQQAAAEHQQQQQRQASLRAQLFAAAVAERSGLSAEDVHAAADWVKQLREKMAAVGANAPVYIAVVPQQQLQLIETAWQQGTGSEGVCDEG